MSPSIAPDGERLSRSHRLRRRSDYLRCYRRGGKRRGAVATLHFHDNREDGPRLGITASRKVGNSVARHRVKRRVREIFRRFPKRGEIGSLDIVVHLWPTAGKATFPTLRSELERLLSSLVPASGQRSVTRRSSRRRRGRSRRE